jgi:hypothetical protein
LNDNYFYVNLYKIGGKLSNVNVCNEENFSDYIRKDIKMKKLTFVIILLWKNAVKPLPSGVGYKA